jgi:hypothetical protein
MDLRLLAEKPRRSIQLSYSDIAIVKSEEIKCQKRSDRKRPVRTKAKRTKLAVAAGECSRSHARNTKTRCELELVLLIVPWYGHATDREAVRHHQVLTR